MNRIPSPVSPFWSCPTPNGTNATTRDRLSITVSFDASAESSAIHRRSSSFAFCDWSSFARCSSAFLRASSSSSFCSRALISRSRSTTVAGSDPGSGL